MKSKLERVELSDEKEEWATEKVKGVYEWLKKIGDDQVEYWCDEVLEAIEQEDKKRHDQAVKGLKKAMKSMGMKKLMGDA